MSRFWCASERARDGSQAPGLLATPPPLGQVCAERRTADEASRCSGSSMFLAQVAGAQCVGDANGDGQVVVNEAVQVVNNLLNGCGGQQPACPIDFSDNNTQEGTPDCFYMGRWNQTCGGADLQARWISDGDIVVVQFLGFDNPPLFYGAGVTSPTSADLIGWFRTPDASDLTDSTGSMTLGESGRSLVIAPNAVPFQVETCDFVHYDGSLTEVVQPSALRAASAGRVDPEVLEHLRSARQPQARPNLERR